MRELENFIERVVIFLARETGRKPQSEPRTQDRQAIEAASAVQAVVSGRQDAAQALGLPTFHTWSTDQAVGNRQVSVSKGNNSKRAYGTFDVLPLLMGGLGEVRRQSIICRPRL